MSYAINNSNTNYNAYLGYIEKETKGRSATSKIYDENFLLKNSISSTPKYGTFDLPLVRSNASILPVVQKALSCFDSGTSEKSSPTKQLGL